MHRSPPIPVLPRARRRQVAVLFGVYIALLTALFVVKDPAVFLAQWRSLTWERLGRAANYANYLPGRTILYYVTLQEDAGTGLRNIGGNLLGFLPFGLLLPLVAPACRRMERLASAALLLSGLFEVFQLLTGVGAFDVDDLLLNGAGALLGFSVLGWLFRKWAPKGHREPHSVKNERFDEKKTA